MPKVGGKHFPYTPKGKAAAKAARAKQNTSMGRNMKGGGKKKK